MYESAKGQQAPGAGPQPGAEQQEQKPGGEQGGKKVENADFEVVDDK